MDHVAIMNPRWRLIEKILSGEKTIESRWYATRRAPWDRVASGDTVYFKDAGTGVTARAAVSRVIQLELPDLAAAQAAVRRYGDRICLVSRDPASWERVPRYAILMFLEHAEAVRPFAIDKAGFGSASAWLSVPEIGKIRKSP